MTSISLDYTSSSANHKKGGKADKVPFLQGNYFIEVKDYSPLSDYMEGIKIHVDGAEETKG